MEERIAKISSSVAVINVGANSEAEVSEIADRVDDAIHATRAALAEGIVAGGGVALYQAASKVELDYGTEAMSEGFDCVVDSCASPLRMILSNGDIPFSSDDFVETNFGIDVKTGKVGNMLEMNIIDPVKVTKTALKNGVSAASTLLSTKAAVINLRRA